VISQIEDLFGSWCAWCAHREPLIWSSLAFWSLVGHVFGTMGLLLFILTAVACVPPASYHRMTGWCSVCLACPYVNPSEAVVQYRTSLYFHHSRSMTFPIIVILLLAGLFVSSWWCIVLLGFIAYLSRAELIHTQLIFWCPWCGGGGGETEVPPEPLPQPVIEKIH
jgi:hypothetical protein